MRSLARFFAAIGILSALTPSLALAQTVPLLTIASPAQPQSTTGLPSQTIAAVAIAVTAGGNSPVSLTSISVSKTGSAPDAAVAGLQVNSDANTIIGSSGGFSNGSATIPIKLTIPAGQTDTLLVSVLTTANLTPYLNEFLDVNITGLGTSAVVQGPLPMYGAQLSLSSGVQAPTCTLSANPSTYGVGQTVDLTWTSTNATGGTITGLGSVGPQGLQGILPSGSGTYTGTFTGAGGTGTCNTSVTFNPQLTNGSVTAGGNAPINAQGGACNGGVGSCAPNTTGNGEPFTPVQSGLVPCQGVNCSPCNVASLVQAIINVLIGLSIPIAAAMFAWAGILYFTSTGSEGRIERAHKIFKTVFWGFLITICSWLLVQTILSAILTPTAFRSWNTISCTNESQRPGTAPSIPGNTPKLTDLLNALFGTTGNTNSVSVSQTPTTNVSTGPANDIVGQYCTGDSCTSTQAQQAISTYNAQAGSNQLTSSSGVSYDQVDPDLLQSIINVTSAANAGAVNITSADDSTHASNSDHYSGDAVDISAKNTAFNAYLQTLTPATNTVAPGQPAYTDGSGTIYMYEPAGTTANTTAGHWHVSI